jgi:hypothetical protein
VDKAYLEISPRAGVHIAGACRRRRGCDQAIRRCVYFEDPDGHLLEVITRPYGSGGWNP